MDVPIWWGLDARTLALTKATSATTAKAPFDRKSEKLAFFLNQIWAHLDQHGVEYPDDEAQMDVIVANLEGEAVVWVTDLRDEGTPELADPDAFFHDLRARFGEPTQTQ